MCDNFAALAHVSNLICWAYESERNFDAMLAAQIAELRRRASADAAGLLPVFLDDLDSHLELLAAADDDFEDREALMKCA